MESVSLELRSFVQKNGDKQIVVVQGLGFVGAAMAVVVASSAGKQYAVVGVDLDNAIGRGRVSLLNSGVFPIQTTDVRAEEYLNNALAEGRFMATTDPSAYSLADIVLIDVNLDVEKHVSQDSVSGEVAIESFRHACFSIASRCKEDVHVIVETTVPPGTCEYVVAPVFEDQLKKRGLENRVLIAHSYERVMPGPNYIGSIQSFYRVYAGLNAASAEATRVFLENVLDTSEHPLTQLESTSASEMSKVLENSYRAMNIAFMREWGQAAEAFNVNLFEIVAAIRKRPTHSNLMKPGLGVGGYCLSKDPLMTEWSLRNFLDRPIKMKYSGQSVLTNDTMPNDSFKAISDRLGSDLKSKDILVLGISYLADVGDTRSTPVEPLVRKLLGCGARVVLCDPFFEWWDELDMQVTRSIKDVVDKGLANNYDAVILSCAHSAFKSQLPLLQTIPHSFVLDCWGMLDEGHISLLNKKHSIQVIGRGVIA